ncbi:MAG: trimethylamine methyltransferase family protein, partial [Hyphomicrobiaceae bacterium]
MASSESPQSDSSRPRRRRRNKTDEQQPAAEPPVWPGTPGGAFRPLSDSDVQRIHGAVLNVLETVGMGGAPDFVVERVTAKGGKLTDTGRLTFPRTLVEEVIAGANRNFILHGQAPGHELNLSGANVHCGSGGAAPSMIDLDTGEYRDATLRDLYDAARVVDALDNIHFFARSVVARDMPTPKDMDINTAYACLRGTAKHVFVSVSEAAHVRPIFDMCAVIAGSAEAYAEKPFLSLNINHVVPP